MTAEPAPLLSDPCRPALKKRSTTILTNHSRLTQSAAHNVTYIPIITAAAAAAASY